MYKYAEKEFEFLKRISKIGGMQVSFWKNGKVQSFCPFTVTPLFCYQSAFSWIVGSGTGGSEWWHGSPASTILNRIVSNIIRVAAEPKTCQAKTANSVLNHQIFDDGTSCSDKTDRTAGEYLFFKILQLPEESAWKSASESYDTDWPIICV